MNNENDKKNIYINEEKDLSTEIINSIKSLLNQNKIENLKKLLIDRVMILGML